MKTLLIILSFITLQAQAALVLEIHGSSFSEKGNRTTQLTYTFQDSGTVELGTRQFLKLEQRNSYTSSDWLIITIQHVNGDNSLSDKDTLLNIQYYKIWDTIPFQPEGYKIIYFDLPQDYPTGKFVIMNTKSADKAYGMLTFPTGLEEETEAISVPAETLHYDLNGHIIQNPNSYDGVLIRKDIYKNGRTATTKRIRR
jgi:hypothetical protein